MLGCETNQVIAKCKVDDTLIIPLKNPDAPERPINGDLAKSHKDMVLMIKKDNERKVRLIEQLRHCQ